MPEYLATYFVADVPAEGFPTRFGVITAYNPNGLPAAHSENLQADSELKQCLDRSRLCHFRVTGRSLDGTHQEPGFGIVVENSAEVEKLARQFNQEAFFWIDGGEVYCIEVGDSTRHRVGAWAERWREKW